MPDSLSLSAGVSLGLLAGIVSGVCYLVANGISWPHASEEPRRGRRIAASSDEGICHRCGGDKQGGIVPCICFATERVKFSSGAWFLRQAQRAATLMPWSLSTDKLEQIEEESEGPGPGGSRREDHEATIREFLETLGAKLAGGPLEGTRVAPLYDHPAYVLVVERYRAPLSHALARLAAALRDALTHLPPLRSGSPSPSSASSARPSSGASSAHVQLKRLVARVVEEAAALPALARYAAEPSTPSIESTTYEDLLATAILNKVIERYQHENGSGGRSSGIHSASASPTPSERSSPRSLNSRTTRDITPPLNEEDNVSDWEEGATDDALDVPRRVPFPEFGGDIVHHTDNEEREFDEVSSSDLQATDGTWEENWLFQKKKIKTIQSVPVPMLVPNSNTDYRALIGDRDADDTTDLSDNASDADEPAEVTEYKSDIKRVLDSKHVIGGKSKIDAVSDFEPDSLNIETGADDFEKLVDVEYKNEKAVDDIINEINDNPVTIVEASNTHATDEVDSLINVNDSVILMGIDDGPLLKAEFNLKEEIHRSLMNGNAHNYHHEIDGNGEEFDDSIESMAINNKESTNNNTLSRHEREGEYEETVTVPVQRYADSLRRKHFDDAPYEIYSTTEEQNNNGTAEDIIPGSIADRERKKWLNYVEMPNNPYSPEAIQKRLSAKSTSSLFDMITTRNKDFEEDEQMSHHEQNGIENIQNGDHVEKEIKPSKLTLTVCSENGVKSRRSESPSPKVLKDVLAEEVPQYKRYGRDYYIREAKASSGGRKKNSLSDTSSVSSMTKSPSLDNFDGEFASPGLLIQQINTIATNQQYTKFANQEQTESITTTSKNNKTLVLIEYEDVNDHTLFSARPAVVDDDTDKKFDEIIKSAYKTDMTRLTINDTEQDKIEDPIKSPVSVANSYVSTSSLEDSIKIYNVQTGEVIKCRPEDNISARYEAVADSNENIDITDNNIPREASDSSSHNEDLDEEAVIIEENGTDKFEIEETLVDGEIEDILSRLPKVKELAKKFVSMENINESVKVSQPQPYSRRRRSKENILNDMNAEKPNKVFMHSLTARSISKEFREELKLSMATPLKVPGGSKEIPDGEEVTKESSRPGSPVPEPGTIKTKLAFFESLKNKFNGKQTG